MRRIIIILITLIFLISSAACHSSNHYHPIVEPIAVDADRFTTGMTFEDFQKLVNPREIVGVMSHYYFIANNGQAVTINFRDVESQCYDRAVSVHICPSTVASNAEWSAIQPGMTDYEVVALVGVPFRIKSSGMLTMDFVSAEGDVYRISWTTDMVVTEVNHLDENVYKS